jgi:hypothetical protein
MNFVVISASTKSPLDLQTRRATSSSSSSSSSDGHGYGISRSLLLGISLGRQALKNISISQSTADLGTWLVKRQNLYLVLNERQTKP